MLIGSRPPEAQHVEELHHSSAPRLGGDPPSSIAAPPPEVLLPPGGSLALAPAPALARGVAPQRVLALDALRLLRDLRDPARWPDRWGDPAFARQTAQIRRHLEPLHSRRTLAASFSREAFQVAIEPGDPVSPIRVAYAIRWLELGVGVDRPGWSVLIAAPGPEGTFFSADDLPVKNALPTNQHANAPEPQCSVRGYRDHEAFVSTHGLRGTGARPHRPAA